ncbi:MULTISPECIES: hypothetical protein [Cyanophyceae]
MKRFLRGGEEGIPHAVFGTLYFDAFRLLFPELTQLPDATP